MSLFEMDNVEEGTNPTVPFYITRQSAHGETMSWYVGMKQALLLIMLGQITLFLWLFIAIIAALALIVGTTIDVVGDVI